ncbi:acyltransferase family protein [Methylomonas montana]|uniref:acyltransferase family protein n=1 Tax=Methylomonas montana TaxID=3058963 RepID=UPI0026581527|nr:acyltransferase family protein [Methylomonas montana]WKJ91130.1 acyltransferase family protein [Methylomonas montana]
MASLQAHLSHPKYRPDIDGLRAIAVISVVAFHAFPDRLQGGFIGVDIFFVISGYLISTIIFQNLERGTFSFAEFYARRIKRIFPALLLVLIASYGFGWFALFADEYKQLGKHIAAGAGFVSNIVLWNEAGYFDNSAETKPLLHLWSLGIEEQFYIVWPLLLWFAWERNFNLLTITLLVAIVSFCLNVKGILSHPVATFYSPQTRFWELLCGSLLAWMTLYKKGLFATLRTKLDGWLAYAVYRESHAADGKTLANALSFVGLFLLVYGFFLINKDFNFPGRWAMVPMVAAVLIISAGPNAWVNRIVLSHPLAVWFGLISFPLYLWHWPLLSFARIVETEVPSINIRIVAVGLAIALAWLTYKLVEKPIRFGSHSSVKTTVLVLLMIGIGYVGYGSYSMNGLEFRQADAPTKTKMFADVNGTVLYNTPEDWVDERCKAALGSSYNYLMCRFTTATPKTLVVGDSHAAQFVYDSISQGSNDLALVAVNGCLPFIDLVTINPTEEFAEKSTRCKVIMPIVLKLLRDFPTIQRVVFATRGAMYIEGSGYGNTEKKNNYRIIKSPDDLLAENYNQFISGYVASINEILKLGKAVVFIEDVPEIGVSAKNCVDERPLRITARELPECDVSRKSFDERNLNYRRAVGSIDTATHNRIKIFPAYEYLCDELSCGGLQDGASYFYDDDHLSMRGSRFIFDKYAEWLGQEPK